MLKSNTLEYQKNVILYPRQTKIKWKATNRKKAFAVFMEDNNELNMKINKENIK